MVDVSKILTERAPALTRTLVAEEPLRIPDFQPSGAVYLGRQMTELGDAAREFRQLYAREQFRLHNFNAEAELLRFQADETNRLTLRSREEPNGAPDFHRRFMDEHAANAAALLNRVHPSARPRATARLAAITSHLSTQTLGRETTIRDEHQNQLINTNLNRLLTDVAADPSRLAELTEQAELLIGQSTLPANARQEALERARGLIQGAALTGHANTNPAIVLDILGVNRRVSAPPAAALVERIRRRATELGMSPDMAAALAYMENSRFDPLARNPSGPNGAYAFGLFQALRDVRERYGITDDIDSQINGGIRHFMAHASDLRRRMGRDLTPAEQYLAYFQGPAGAEAILRAASENPNALVLDVLAASIGPQHAATVGTFNRFLRGMTVGRLIAHTGQRVNNAIRVTGGVYNNELPIVHPDYANVPFDRRITIGNHALERANQDEIRQGALTTRLGAELSDRLLRDGLMIDFRMNNPPTDGTQPPGPEALNEFILQNAHQMTPGDLRVLMALARREERATRDNPEMYLEVSNMALDPATAQESIRRAAQMYTDGHLRQQSFREIRNMATATIQRVSETGIELRGHYRLMQRQIEQQLAGVRVLGVENELTRNVRMNAVREFSQWFMRNNHQVNSDQISERAATLISDAQSHINRVQSQVRLQNQVFQLYGVRTLEEFGRLNISQLLGGYQTLERRLRRRLINETQFREISSQIFMMELMTEEERQNVAPAIRHGARTTGRR